MIPHSITHIEIKRKGERTRSISITFANLSVPVRFITLGLRVKMLSTFFIKVHFHTQKCINRKDKK